MADPAIRLIVLDELNIALRYDHLDIAEVVAALQARRARPAHRRHRPQRQARDDRGGRPRHRDDAGEASLRRRREGAGRHRVLMPPGARSDDPGHGLGRRQVAGRRRACPRLHAARPEGAAVQAAEHVEQRRRHRRRRRDRPRPGAAGARRAGAAQRAHEPGAAEAAERDRLAGRGAGQGRRHRQGARIPGDEAQAAGRRAGELRQARAPKPISCWSKARARRPR